MRLVLDITSTPDRRYQGHVTVPGTSLCQEFASVLEFLAILERLLLADGNSSSASSAES